jgi:superfamily I DNA/RNA helicase
MSLVSDQENPTLDDVERALQSSRGSFDETERAGDPERVQIMSMHSAKGLTSDAVIVAACEDELIPGSARGKEKLMMRVAFSTSH